MITDFQEPGNRFMEGVVAADLWRELWGQIRGGGQGAVWTDSWKGPRSRVDRSIEGAKERCGQKHGGSQGSVWTDPCRGARSGVDRSM
jgi:hypothetical protein